MSKREQMHRWFADHRAAEAGDLAAAVRYEVLAETCPGQRAEYLAAAAASRASAQANHDAMARRLAGTYQTIPAERALKKGEVAR